MSVIATALLLAPCRGPTARPALIVLSPQTKDDLAILQRNGITTNSTMGSSREPPAPPPAPMTPTTASQHKGLVLFMVLSSANCKVTILDMALPNNDVSYETLKETPYVVRGSPSSVTTTPTTINLTFFMLILST